MRDLEDLFKELGYNPSQYAKWCYRVLRGCKEGYHYTVETNKYGKRQYKITDIATIIILEKYLGKTPNITKELILSIAEASKIPCVKAMSDVPIDLFDYFMSQIRKAFNASVPDIPDEYIMPSEIDVSYKTLRDLNILNEDKRVIEKSYKVLPRIIVKARGELDYHVILSKEASEELKTYIEENKPIKAPPKTTTRTKKPKEIPYDL